MSLVILPSRSQVFSTYRPSTNAHTDILGRAQVPCGKHVSLNIPPGPSTDSIHSLIRSFPLILAGKPTELSLSALSSMSKRLAPFHSKDIRTALHDALESRAQYLVRRWKASIMARESNWPDRFVAGWEEWQQRVSLLASITVYIDEPINGTSTFIKTVWRDPLIESKTRDDFIRWADSERSNSGMLQRPTIVSLYKMTLHFDDKSLGRWYRESLEDHYSQVAAREMEPTQYIQWVLTKADEETERVIACLSSDMAGGMANKVWDICGPREGVVKLALQDCLGRQDPVLFERLYRFSTHSDQIDNLVKALQGDIDSRLRDLIKDPVNDAKMIEGILKLRRFIDRALKVPPDIPQRVQLDLEEAVRQGFKSGLGSRQNAPAEWIAKHLDLVMRRGQGSGTEEEFNSLLDEIVALIGYTRDRDVFKAFYSTQLAKRLLLNKSASDDMERNMIVKLQKEMGEEFTTGDVMMKDLALSESLATKYQAHSGRDALTANVLTESAWPTYPLLKDGWNFQLTRELQSSVDQFTTWYQQQHKNRQLSWRWQLATVSLTGRFPSGRYELGVSLFQAVVLLQFNQEDSFTMDELHARTGIERHELVRVLQSLALGRKGTRVLLKRPPGKDVSPNDIFVWNKGFSSERVKFKINQIQQDMSAEESRKTNEQVHIDRVSVLEATIVRIMKGKKEMSLQLLIDAVVRDVSKRFPPDVKEIKKRVESLIEREFLERAEDRNMLHYVA